MTTPPNRAARRHPRNGNGPEGPDTESMEYKVDALTWLLAEQSERVIRLAQAVASILVQASQPQITAGVINQLLCLDAPIQGAPPVLPGR